jgi:hypothetical protein
MKGDISDCSGKEGNSFSKIHQVSGSFGQGFASA